MPLPSPLREQWSQAALSRSEIAALCLANLLESDARVYFKDLECRFLAVSQGWVKEVAPHLSSAAEVVGKTDFDFFTEPHARAAFEDEQQILRTGQAITNKRECETYLDRPDVWVSTMKMPLRGPDGSIMGTFGISHDITAQVQAEIALAYHALHDSLTGLANRVALMDRLSQAIAELERHPGRVCVMFVDLDNFKEINDTQDHETGDKVLVEAARRLSAAVRRADTVARFGGDEFTVLYRDLRPSDELPNMAGRIVAALSVPFADGGIDLTVTASVGVTVTSDPRVSAGELLKQADIAMYQAKRAGGDRAHFFDAHEPRKQSRWASCP